jgi:ABC-type amino acid transport substrate-binding protein
MKVEKVMEADQNLKKIAAGRIDVTFDDPVWAETESKRNGYGLKALAPLVAIDGTHVTFGPKLKDLRDKFTSKAEEMIKAGVLDKLYEKHAGITMKAFKTKYGIK